MFSLKYTLKKNKKKPHISQKPQTNLIQHLHLRAPHLEQDIKSLLHCTRFRVSQAHASRQTDKPQAITVAEQTLSPQLRV